MDRQMTRSSLVVQLQMSMPWKGIESVSCTHPQIPMYRDTTWGFLAASGGARRSAKFSLEKDDKAPSRPARSGSVPFALYQLYPRTLQFELPL
jgi:hypothetical protein